MKSKIKDRKSDYKYWEKVMDSKAYKKGEFDSMTNQLVLATRKENYFAPENCYFDYVKNLPNGTIYVDGE
jgi:hypothetical protein